MVPIYDFRNKQVGIVGNGSSAIQIVPSLQPLEGINMRVFMRSPTWISGAFGDAVMTALGLDPATIECEPLNSSQGCPKVTGTLTVVTAVTPEKQEQLAREPKVYLEMRKVIETAGNQIHDSTIRGTAMQKQFVEDFSTSMRQRLAKKPELFDAIVPTFAPGCRRLTPGKGYLEALTENNVEVVKDSIVEISETGIKLDN